MVKAISAVGNYGEIYERNIGDGIPRGLNKLWTDGGLDVRASSSLNAVHCKNQRIPSKLSDGSYFFRLRLRLQE